jgi:hypothetical protein
MYKWYIQYYGPVRNYGRFSDICSRMYDAGFSCLDSLDELWAERQHPDDLYCYYNYTTTHRHSSAMMMHLLKYPNDGITIIREWSVV